MSAFLKQYLTEKFTKILSSTAESSKAISLKLLVDWYVDAPQCTTFRINTLLHDAEDVLPQIAEELKKRYNLESSQLPSIKVHDTIPECITIGRLNEAQLDLIPVPDEVIVDAFCGAAVLRGAHVFAPGVLGMLPDVSVGAKVSVYSDLSSKCLRGYKKRYEAESKLFVGNGIAMKNRHQLFDGGKPEKGIAVFVTNPVSGVVMFNSPEQLGVLQNFPSMVCVRTLDPKPGETVLDMCAAPGNKTTHIAALMKDEGILIAIDNPKKIDTIVKNCTNLSIQNCVKAFKGDSTKLVSDDEREITDGPPFSINTFDKILLDVPCSGLGQRPMFRIRVDKTSLKTFPPLQKKFVRNAVRLLKPGGHMVYSTCSILCEENECVVAWILEKYPEMELVPSKPHYGGPGLPDCGLNEEQRHKVQRFGLGTSTEDDTIGFFMAKLRKKPSEI
ncbi:tRNA (cytosine(72)-C(5))-methyltransferase NSUN6 [Planococcus citri]|uniref:tRNA (cytosine(72)-C(5))-methyltransferase NSUN6 n=1 Tax=Planococcus citri TaxID=170843 RepID=UPI0031FA25CA